jgi:hypothetical protein
VAAALSGAAVGRWRPGLLIAVALLAMGPVIGGQWVSDDVDLVAESGVVHRPSGLWHGFVEPYWPPPSVDGLYRPLAIASFTAQWLLGGGATWPFRLVSLGLYVAAVLAVWSLLRRLTGEGGALAGALLFAVHPVHTEAVALVVNQGELVVALLAALSARWVLDADDGRRTPGELLPWLLLAQLAALGFKEHAVAIPLLLGMLLLVRRRGALAELRPWVPTLAALVLVTAGFWAARTAVLGDLVGAAPAAGLPTTIGTRAVTMLGVVPTWVRLLLWPLHLQGDYAPQELPPWSGDLTAPWVGVLLLLTWALATRHAWRAHGAAVMGLLWVPIALGPVSNLFAPTGIWLAERTLFLPTIGVALAAAAVADRIAARRGVRILAATVGIIAALGASRSALRIRDWRDPGTAIAAMLRDAPRSYRAQMAAGSWAFDSLGDRRGGERHLREAIRLWPHDPAPWQTLADRYRADGMCGAAIPLYRSGLAVAPRRVELRVSLLACHFHRGEWSAASAVARDTSVTPTDRPWFAALATTADSAARVAAPAGSVRVPDIAGAFVDVGRRPR